MKRRRITGRLSDCFGWSWGICQRYDSTSVVTIVTFEQRPSIYFAEILQSIALCDGNDNVARGPEDAW